MCTSQNKEIIPLSNKTVCFSCLWSREETTKRVLGKVLVVDIFLQVFVYCFPRVMCDGVATIRFSIKIHSILPSLSLSVAISKIYDHFLSTFQFLRYHKASEVGQFVGYLGLWGCWSGGLCLVLDMFRHTDLCYELILLQLRQNAYS